MDATVVLLSPSGHTVGFTFVEEGVGFVFYGLSPLTNYSGDRGYSVTVSYDGFITQERTGIVLEPGYFPLIEFFLEPELATVSGTVVSSDPSKPLEIYSGSGIHRAAVVYLFDENDGSTSPVYYTNVQADDTYVIEDVPAGDYQIHATAPNFAYENRLKTIASGDDLEENFVLDPLNGTVLGTIYSVKFDGSQSTLTGALVEIKTEGLEKTTVSGGEYIFDRLDEGSYEIKVSKQHYVSNHAWVDIVNGVTLIQDIETYVIVAINGTVYDEDGNELSGVEMVLTGGRLDEFLETVNDIINEYTTGSDGIYQLKRCHLESIVFKLPLMVMIHKYRPLLWNLLV